MKRFTKTIIYIVASIIFIIVFAFLLVNVSTKKYVWSKVEDVPHTQTALILGASILKNGNLSLVLRDRVDMAIKLYEAKKVEQILVSGDNSTLSYNEVNPVRLYLLDKGIPDQDIFLDHAGFDTYSSMYRARDVFQASSMTVVTQSFHLQRSVFIARSLGIEAVGISADKRNYKLKNYTRELLANVKAIMNLVSGREPKYLGKEIPLTGDGRDN